MKAILTSQTVLDSVWGVFMLMLGFWVEKIELFSSIRSSPGSWLSSRFMPGHISFAVEHLSISWNGKLVRPRGGTFAVSSTNFGSWPRLGQFRRRLFSVFLKWIIILKSGFEFPQFCSASWIEFGYHRFSIFTIFVDFDELASRASF